MREKDGGKGWESECERVGDGGKGWESEYSLSSKP